MNREQYREELQQIEGSYYHEITRDKQKRA